MARYLAGRVLQAVFVLWAAFTATFVILFLLPADPALLMLSTEGATSIDPAQVAALRAEHGLDRPVLVQYGDALVRALHGDFGISLYSSTPVVQEITTALPETLKLAGLALVIAVLLGATIATLATFTRWRWLGQALLALPPLGVAIPGFWVGLLLLQLLSFRLGLFPASGNGGLDTLVLPAVTLAIPTSAVVAQVLSKSLAESWRQPYVATAAAKGVSRLRIHFVHVLRNATLPALTIVGMVVGNMFSGAVVTETIFSRAGVGKLTQKAVEVQDIPMVQGLVVLSAAVFVLVSLAVDLVYPILDPRIRRRPPTRTARQEALA